MTNKAETKYNRYNRINNEGGGGYNPYTEEKTTEEPIINKLWGQHDRTLHIMEGVSTADPRYAELGTKLAGIKEQIELEESK